MQGPGPSQTDWDAILSLPIYPFGLNNSPPPSPQGSEISEDLPDVVLPGVERMPVEGADIMEKYVGVEADDPDQPVFDLTQDLLYKVFSHLDAGGLCSVAQVCRQWGSMSGHEDFWHTLDFTKRNLSVEQIAEVCMKFPKASTVFVGRTSRLDSSGLQQTLGRLRNLTSLHIHRFQGGMSAADGFGPALEQHCPNLQHLSLNGVMLMSAMVVVRHPKLEELVLIDTHCPGLHVVCPALKTLNLLQHVDLSGSLLLECPLLETVDFSGCNKLADVALRTVLVTLPELRSLNVTSCALITDDTMRQVAVACAKLERLNASHCPLLTFATVRLPALLEFTATSCESVATDCVNMLGHSLYLERLTLDYCGKLASLELELYYLQSVSLFNCRSLSDVKLRTPRLSTFELGPRSALRRIDIYSAELRALSLCGQPHLREVKLRGPELTSLDLTECDALYKLTGETFADAEACPKLTSLKLNHCEGLTRLSLASLSLSRLSLSGCSALCAVDLTCPSLTSLQTDGCTQLARARLAPVALADVNLGTCPHLASLCVQSSQMERLELRGCGALEEMNLDCPVMTQLDTSYCSKLSSLSLIPLAAKCRSLSTLILAGAAVSAENLLALHNLRQLSKLDLSYTEIDSLAAVVSLCGQLRALLLSACKRLPDTALTSLHFGQLLPQLDHLDVSYCNFSAEAIGDLLARAPHIARLDLNGCSKVDDSIWDRLAKDPEKPTEETQWVTECSMQSTGLGPECPVDRMLADEVARGGEPTGAEKAELECPVKFTKLEAPEKATDNGHRGSGLVTGTAARVTSTQFRIPIEGARTLLVEGDVTEKCEDAPAESPEHSWMYGMQWEGVAGSPGKVAKRLREVTLGDREARGDARQRVLTSYKVTSLEGSPCVPTTALVLAATGPAVASSHVTELGCPLTAATIDGRLLDEVWSAFPDVPKKDGTLALAALEPAPWISGQARPFTDVSQDVKPVDNGAEPMSDGAPMNVEPRERRLTSLSLVGCKKLRTVRVVEGTCPVLTDLNVSLCENVREVRVAGSRLTHLNLKQCLALTSAHVDCPILRTLDVQGSKLDDNQIRDMVSGCAALETLDVRGCGRVKAADTLTWVREMCPALRRLHSDPH